MSEDLLVHSKGYIVQPDKIEELDVARPYAIVGRGTGLESYIQILIFLLYYSSLEIRSRCCG